jgi:hypothetical protein
MDENGNRLVIQVSRERIGEITVEDLLALEDGKATLRARANLVAVFVMNGDGYMEAEAARAAVRQLTVRQLNETVTAVLRELNEAAVPNE